MKRRTLWLALLMAVMLSLPATNTQAVQIPLNIPLSACIPEEFLTTLSYLPPLPEYVSGAVIVMDAETGLILYERDQHARLYPASITKVMTALVVLEHVTDLSETLHITEHSVLSLPSYASRMGIQPGETLTMREALYGIMLPSANEVSIAMAEHVSGNVEDFVDLMNQRAYSLGAVNTRFINPSGLPGDNQYTTAYDVALIMREAVRFPAFIDAIAAAYFELPPRESQPEGQTIRNTNWMIREEGPYFHGAVIGGKTGFTNAAQHTLVTFAERDGRSLIVTTLFAPSRATFTDTASLLEYGFSLPYEYRTVFRTDINSWTVPVFYTSDIEGAEEEQIGQVSIRGDSDLLVRLPVDFSRIQLRTEISVPEKLSPPIEAGDVLGLVTVYAQDIWMGEMVLRAENSVYLPEILPEAVLRWGDGMVGVAQLAIAALAVAMTLVVFVLIVLFSIRARNNRKQLKRMRTYERRRANSHRYLETGFRD